MKRLGFGISLAALLTAALQSGVTAQVVIGGDYQSEVTTGAVTSSASGDGATASRCVGGIQSGDKPLRIDGDVKTVVNGVEQTDPDANCIADPPSKKSGHAGKP